MRGGLGVAADVPRQNHRSVGRPSRLLEGTILRTCIVATAGLCDDSARTVRTTPLKSPVLFALKGVERSTPQIVITHIVRNQSYLLNIVKTSIHVHILIPLELRPRIGDDCIKLVSGSFVQ